MKRHISSPLNALAILLNAAFPILTTPLAALAAGSQSFAQVGLMALLAYFQSTLVDAGISAFGVARWSSKSLSASGSRIRLANITLLQLSIGICLSPIILLLAIFWLKLSVASSLIAIVSGFSPVFFPSWALILTGNGATSLSSVFVSRASSIGLLAIVLLVGGGDGSANLVATAWLLVPAFVPFLIISARTSLFTWTVRSFRRRFIASMLKHIGAGLVARISIAIYGGLPALIIGRFETASIAASYMFIDRCRVIGQTMLGNLMPVLLHSTAGRFFRGSGYRLAILAIGSSLIFFCCFMLLFPVVVRALHSQEGWAFSPTIILLMAALGGVVVCSNAYVALGVLVDKGQSVMPRVLVPAVIVALVTIPLGFFHFSTNGALIGALVVELFVLAGVLFLYGKPNR